MTVNVFALKVHGFRLQTSETAAAILCADGEQYMPRLFCTDEQHEGILCGCCMVCWLSCFLLELLLWQQSFPWRFGRHLCGRTIDWWKSVSLQAFTDDVIIIDLSVG